jgi:hypothetical protein
MNQNLRNLAKETKNPNVIEDFPNDNNLYVSIGNYVYAITKSFTMKVSSHHYPTLDMCVYKGQPFVCNEKGVFHATTNAQVTDREQIGVLCVHDGKLLDAGGLGIFETFSNKQLDPRQVCAIESCCGNLYCARPTQEGTEIFKDKASIALRPDVVNAFGSLDGFVYDCGEYDGVYSSEINSPLFSKRPIDSRGFCVHDGRLYDFGDYGIYDTLKGECVGERTGSVLAMCSHMGRLYDCGLYDGVYDTLQNEMFRMILDQGTDEGAMHINMKMVSLPKWPK